MDEPLFTADGRPAKVCAKCRETKAATEFGIDQRTSDQRNRLCNACRGITTDTTQPVVRLNLKQRRVRQEITIQEWLAASTDTEGVWCNDHYMITRIPGEVGQDPTYRIYHDEPTPGITGVYTKREVQLILLTERERDIDQRRFGPGTIFYELGLDLE